jgi:hypothetical protein
MHDHFRMKLAGEELSPLPKGEVGSHDNAIRVRGYGLTRDCNPSPDRFAVDLSLRERCRTVPAPAVSIKNDQALDAH